MVALFLVATGVVGNGCVRGGFARDQERTDIALLGDSLTASDLREDSPPGKLPPLP